MYLYYGKSHLEYTFKYFLFYKEGNLCQTSELHIEYENELKTHFKNMNFKMRLLLNIVINFEDESVFH